MYYYKLKRGRSHYESVKQIIVSPINIIISMMDTIIFVKNCCKPYYDYKNKVLLTTFEQGVEFVSTCCKI